MKGVLCACGFAISKMDAPYQPQETQAAQVTCARCDWFNLEHHGGHRYMFSDKPANTPCAQFKPHDVEAQSLKLLEREASLAKDEDESRLDLLKEKAL